MRVPAIIGTAFASVPERMASSYVTSSGAISTVSGLPVPGLVALADHEKTIRSPYTFGRARTGCGGLTFRRHTRDEPRARRESRTGIPARDDVECPVAVEVPRGDRAVSECGGARA